MQWYPFDIQKCHLNFLMKGKSGDNAELGNISIFNNLINFAVNNAIYFFSL